MAKSQEIRPGPSLARRATVPADSQNHAKPFSRSPEEYDGAARLEVKNMLHGNRTEFQGRSKPDVESAASKGPQPDPENFTPPDRGPLRGQTP